MAGQTVCNGHIGVRSGFRSPDENPEVFHQSRYLVAQSQDDRYHILAGKKYRNLMIYDTQLEQAILLQRSIPWSIEQQVVFVDLHTFCVDSRDYVHFYNARTGEHVDFLEMQFGDRKGQKTLLGFTYDRDNTRFAALFVDEEPSRTWGHCYQAALFDREGKLLDRFETGVELVANWGKIVVPQLTLSEDLLKIASPDFTADYEVCFFTHETTLRDKPL